MFRLSVRPNGDVIVQTGYGAEIWMFVDAVSEWRHYRKGFDEDGEVKMPPAHLRAAASVALIAANTEREIREPEQ
jgi:hypothetical protein